MQVVDFSSVKGMPSVEVDGYRFKTLNNFGWMSTMLSEPVPQFIEAALNSSNWALDIGCAYGAHPLAAINAGARVVANDLDERHLQVLRTQVGDERQDKLITVCGPFPDVELPRVPISVALSNRVFHFFDPATLERAAAKLFNTLVPGGKVFMRAVTPYMGVSTKFIPEYERRRDAGERYPGFVADRSVYVDRLQEGSTMTGAFHFLDPMVLSRTFSEAGFVIQRAEFLPITLDPWTLDGREAVIVVAAKPLATPTSTALS